jgi:hypothetical protein
MMLVMFTSLANPHFLFDDELARFSLLLQVLFSFSQSGPHSARFAPPHKQGGSTRYHGLRNVTLAHGRLHTVPTLF